MKKGFDTKPKSNHEEDEVTRLLKSCKIIKKYMSSSLHIVRSIDAKENLK